MWGEVFCIYLLMFYAIQGITHPKRVNPLGRWFGRMAFTTGQPRFEPDGGDRAGGRSGRVGGLAQVPKLGPTT